MRDIRRGLWLMAFGITLFVAAQMFADEPGDVRGGYFVYSWSQGKFAWEPFLKVQSKQSPSESGEPEVWGFRPWNLLPPEEDGTTKVVNVLESHFIPCDGKHHKKEWTHPHDPDRKIERWLKCPDILWNSAGAGGSIAD